MQADEPVVVSDNDQPHIAISQSHFEMKVDEEAMRADWSKAQEHLKKFPGTIEILEQAKDFYADFEAASKAFREEIQGSEKVYPEILNHAARERAKEAYFAKIKPEPEDDCPAYKLPNGCEVGHKHCATVTRNGNSIKVGSNTIEGMWSLMLDAWKTMEPKIAYHLDKDGRIQPLITPTFIPPTDEQSRINEANAKNEYVEPKIGYAMNIPEGWKNI